MVDMTREQFLLRVVSEAVERPAQERDRHLEESCGSDPELLADARSFMAQVDEGGKFPVLQMVHCADDATPWIGETLEGLGKRNASARYVVREELGSGGMATVYRAWDPDLGRDIAMKVSDQTAVKRDDQPTFVDHVKLGRFLREAQVAAGLQHPGVVPVHELGVDADGRLYFTMQVVQGETLETVLSRLADSEQDQRDESHDGKTGWNLPRVLGVLLKVCETLAYAHSRGVLHRDVKPSNIMVGRFGEVYVLDWGLLFAADGADRADLRPAAEGAGASAPRLSRVRRATRDGTAIGTPSYMPPERACVQHGPVRLQSDVYSVGAVLYHVLTGTPPYVVHGEEVEEAALLTRVLAGPPAPVRTLASHASEELVAICEKAMARDPDGRYADMGELAEDLRAHLEGRVVRAHRTGPIIELRKWVGRHRAFAGLLVAVLIIGLLLAWAYATFDEVREANAFARVERLERHLEEGYMELSQRNAVAALRAYRAALDEDETSPDAFAGLVLAHLTMEDTPKALALLDGRPEMEERYPTLAFLRADVARAVGDAELARRLDDSIPPPRTPLALGLAGFHALRRGLAGDTSAFPRAHTLLLRAILCSETPRPLHYHLLTVAAVHVRDKETLSHVAAAFVVLWPERSLTHFVLGVIKHEQGDLEAAVFHFRRAAQLRPGSYATWNNLGTVLVDKDDLDEAKNAFRRAIQLQPEDPAPHSNLAMVLLRCGDARSAERAAEEALRLNPNYAPAHVNLGNVMWHNGDVHTATKHYRRALEILPDDARTLYNLGNALRRTEDLDKAIAVLKEADHLEPDDPKIQLALALALSDSGDLDGAIVTYRRAIQTSPAAILRYNLALVLEKSGKPDEAIDMYREAIHLKPDYAEAHRNLGLALARRNDVEGAIAAFDQALAVRPDWAMVHADLAVASRSLGDHKRAIHEWSEAVRLEPDNPRYLGNLGSVLLAAGHTREAIAKFEEATRLRPDDTDAHEELGDARNAVGDIGGAIESYRRAIDSAAPRAWAFCKLGRVLAATGRIERAARCYKTALGLRPEFPEALCELGNLHLRTGDYDLALARLQVGHELGSKLQEWHQPSAEWLERARRFATDEKLLDAMLDGNTTPEGYDERITVAEHAYHRQRHRAAAGLYEAAFAENPAGKSTHRYRAACCAAVAGSHADGVEWRARALAWLREELIAIEEFCRANPAKTAEVRRALSIWKLDPDLASIRDGDEGWSDEEKQNVLALWSGVDRLLQGLD